MRHVVPWLASVLVVFSLVGCDSAHNVGGGVVGDGGSVDDGGAVGDGGVVDDGGAVAVTLSYASATYSFIWPGTKIDPLVPTATGAGTLTYAGTNLPPGLEVDATTGQITGAPTPPTSPSDPVAPGSFDSTVTVTDGTGHSASWAIHFTLSITGAMDHAVSVDTSCAYCAIPSPATLTGVHVGDTVTFSTTGGGDFTVSPGNGEFYSFAVPFYMPFSLGINGGAGTAIAYTTSPGQGHDSAGTITISH